MNMNDFTHFPEKKRSMDQSRKDSRSLSIWLVTVCAVCAAVWATWFR
jgi:hypothetical protein